MLTRRRCLQVIRLSCRAFAKIHSAAGTFRAYWLYSMKRALFLINPQTAKAALSPHLIDIIDLLEKSGYAVQIHMTQSKGDACRTVTAIGDKFSLVICAGGDGTLNETVSGLLHTETKPPIGYIPSGTTNDFAVSWGIPTNPLEAAHTIVRSEPLAMDVCLFGERPYVYVAAFGAFTEASYSTPQPSKQVFGRTAYIVEGIKSLQNLRPWHIRIEHDDGVVEGEYLYGMFSNTRSVGGFPLRMREEISLSDGLMEVILVKSPENALDNPKMLGAVLAQDIKSEYITFLHTRHLTFTAAEPIPWTIDGEFGGKFSEGEMSVLHTPIRMFFA